MASPAQIAANRANAQRSTGPRTAAGKARSGRNHTTHGLSSKEFVVLPGDEQEFDELMTALHESVLPQGALESDLFTHLAHASWTLRRCRRAEAQLQVEAPGSFSDLLLAPEFDARLRAIQLFAQRAERTYHRTLKELKALQNDRALRSTKEYRQLLVAPGRPALPPLSEEHKRLTPLLRLASVEAQARKDRERADQIAAVQAALASYAEDPPAPRPSNPIPPRPAATDPSRR